jgi:DHA3 family multidrug efflux protein-like MFS transporter
MLLSSFFSLILYSLAGAIYVSAPPAAFTDISNVLLWVFIVIALFGAIAGNLRGITLSTLVTILIPEEKRDKANGLVGTTTGVAFLAASVFSGLAIGFLGVVGVLAIAIGMTLVVIIHMWTISIPEYQPAVPDEGNQAKSQANGIDIRGTIRVIYLVPGLFPIIFHT